MSEAIQELKERNKSLHDLCEQQLRVIKDIASHARREWNGKEQYESDTYGYIFKKCMSSIEEYRAFLEQVEPQLNEIVQLCPDTTENKMFAGCMMVVTDVKDWGVQGYVQGLGENGQPGGQAYYRAKWGTFEKTGGRSSWIVS